MQEEEIRELLKSLRQAGVAFEVCDTAVPEQTRDWYLFRPNNPGYDRYQSPRRTASSQCGLDEFRRSQGQIQ